MPAANRNTPKIRIITNAVSDGARALAESLRELGIDVSRVRATSGPKTPRRQNIKWGCFNLDPRDYGGPMANAQSGEASLNKLQCFRVLEAAGVPVPQYTDSQATAQSWIAAGCRRIYERHSLRGSEGEGIRIVGEGGEAELSRAPLYTKGMFGRRREYRIHVFNMQGTQRIFVQQKRRRTTGVNPADNAPASTVRNLANGWIFAHNDVVAPRQATLDAAVAACAAMRLEFGAVDMIEMDRAADGGSVVLEINCAPGLQGGTLDFYANAFNDFIRGINRTVEVPVAEAQAVEGVDDEEGPVGDFADPEA